MAILSSKSGDLSRRGPDDFQLISRVERFPGVKLGDRAMLDSAVKLPDTASSGAPFDPEISGGAPISLDALPNPPSGSDREFTRLVMFTPQGGAALDNGEESSSQVPVYESLQVVVVPSKGPDASETERKSASVVYLNGVTGLSTVYRPSL